MKEISQIEVYEALKEKIGEDVAKLLVEYVESKKKEVATKEDIMRLEKDIQRVENEINELRKEQRRNLYWILGFHITLWATTIAGIITILLKIKS
jgi:predicted  nucleic acid-binding Zn-ribbon protein